MPHHTTRATPTTIASAAALAAVLVAGCSAVLDPATGAGAPTGLLSIERPGYGPNGPAVGDPAALVTRPPAPAVVYRGTPVVQACNLITIDDFPVIGLPLLGGTSPIMVQRDHLDGQGQAALPYVTDILTGEDNRCLYLLDADGPTGEERAGIEIQVHQPGYALPELLDRRLDWDYHRVTDLVTARGPVQVFEPDRPLDGYATPWLRYGDVHVALSVDNQPPHLAETVLAIVAQRLPELVAAPTGPQRFDYDSPVFPTGYVNGCEISTAQDFRDLFGVEPSPSVDEGLASGVGRIIFTDTGLEANYISHSCTRHTPATNLDSTSLHIETQTYDSTEAAIADMDFSRTTGHGVDTPTLIGDESFAGTYVDYDAIFVRVATTVVTLFVFDGHSTLTGSVHEALLPIATTIAARIPTQT